MSYDGNDAACALLQAVHTGDTARVGRVADACERTRPLLAGTLFQLLRLVRHAGHGLSVAQALDVMDAAHLRLQVEHAGQDLPDGTDPADVVEFIYSVWTWAGDELHDDRVVGRIVTAAASAPTGHARLQLVSAARLVLAVAAANTVEVDELTAAAAADPQAWAGDHHDDEDA